VAILELNEDVYIAGRAKVSSQHRLKERGAPNVVPATEFGNAPRIDLDHGRWAGAAVSGHALVLPPPPCAPYRSDWYWLPGLADELGQCSAEGVDDAGFGENLVDAFAWTFAEAGLTGKQWFSLQNQVLRSEPVANWNGFSSSAPRSSHQREWQVQRAACGPQRVESN
jgi:hypothetical protein